MKKIIRLILTLTIMIPFTSTIISCGDEHVHSYGPWEVIVKADCEHTGERKKTCECGYELIETIPELGHNFVNGVCTVCGKVEEH